MDIVLREGVGLCGMVGGVVQNSIYRACLPRPQLHF